MPYPVVVTVDALPEHHDRLTTALRAILAIPHMMLVGPVHFGVENAGHWRSGAPTGLLAAAAYVLAVVSWFTILITGEHPQNIRDFCLYYLRWRVRATAYIALFADQYPPFGDGPYPANLSVADPATPRDHASIAVRLILALPHLVVLFFVLIGWFVTTVIAWFSIVFTGEYPKSLLPFGLGAMRWAVRVEAYLLLLVDEYPPFSLD